MYFHKCMTAIDVLVIQNLTLGQRIRLVRIANGLRQIDLASMTGLNSGDICNAELDRSIHRWKLDRILEALELERKN